MSNSTTSLRHRFVNNKHYPIINLPCHSSKVHSVRWSPDGLRIASGGQDHYLRLHRIIESSIHQDLTFKGHSDAVDQLCWNPTTTSQVATASNDKTCRIWDVRSNDPCQIVKLKNENMSVCWSPDGQTIAVGDKADIVSFLDVRLGYKVFKEQGFKFEVGETTWNKTNDLFFLTSGDGKIHVFSYPDVQSVVAIDAFSSACICIQFDATGKYFAVGSNDALSAIWDSANLACTTTISRPDWPVRAVSFSHDSKYLVSGSEDNFIDIADVFTGEQISSIHTNYPVSTLDFNPKDYILAYAVDESGREEGSIKIIGLKQ